jgi:hypothetical protein
LSLARCSIDTIHIRPTTYLPTYLPTYLSTNLPTLTYTLLLLMMTINFAQKKKFKIYKFVNEVILEGFSITKSEKKIES